MNKQKVLVITRHAIANYGSLLQAVATQKAVENLGFECKIINYIRKDEYHANSTVTIAKKKKRIRFVTDIKVLKEMNWNSFRKNQEKSCLRIQQRKGFVPIAVFLLMMLIRLLLMSCRRIIMKI